MKKITLKNSYKEVSATFKDETDLSEVLYTIEGMITSLGYGFKGHLEFVEEEE